MDGYDLAIEQASAFRGNYLYDSARERNPPATETGLHDTSFAGAELRWIGLTNGCVLENVEMPRSGEAFICDQVRLMWERDSVLGSIADPAVRETLARYFDVRSYDLERQPQCIVSVNDLLKPEPKLEPAVRAAYALLQRFTVVSGHYSASVH